MQTHGHRKVANAVDGGRRLYKAADKVSEMAVKMLGMLRGVIDG
jgi:hypothetical protein